MWSFPTLSEPSVFIAAPGDVAYLRQAVAIELDDLRRRAADDHGITLYNWEIDRAEDGFRDWIPAQGQIPLPSDPNCRAVICILGERVGTPLSADFDTAALGPLESIQGNDARLVHPWQPGAEADGGFSLTGTLFEYLAALRANLTRGTDGSAIDRGHPPVLLLIVGDESILEDCDPVDQNWGGHALLESAEERFRAEHPKNWRSALRDWERDDYLPQVAQLGNFRRFLNSRSIFPRIVADETQARREIRDFLVRELDLRVHSEVRDPFKGLLAYDLEDNEVFFGREAERSAAVAELSDLWADATRPNFYGVIGGSGVGKSSLMRAGLVGRLCHQTSRGRYLACIVRPDELLPDPLRTLFEHSIGAIADAGGAIDVGAQLRRFDAIRPEQQPAEAVESIAASLVGLGAEWRMLITFDQFEELIDGRANPETAATWAPVVDFIALAARHPALGVIYTLQTNRSELIAHDPLLGPLWARGGNLRLAFPEHSLDDIIRKPFEITGLVRLEPELVRTLRDRILHFAHQTEGGSQGSLLPLVSLTLRRIFEASRERLAEHPADAGGASAAASAAAAPTAAAAAEAARVDAGIAPGDAAPAPGAGEPDAGLPRLGVADCDGLLDVEGAIADLANAAVEEAQAASGADWSDEVIDSLLRRVVRLSGSASERLALPDAPMPAQNAPRRLAQALIQRRLLLVEPGGRIKLVHEAVLSHWPAAVAWRERERRLLRFAGIVAGEALDWDETGRDPASLSGHGEHNIDQAAELLALWHDVFGAPAVNTSDALSRDYALALLLAHPTPRRVVQASPTQTRHIHIATTYGDLPLLGAHLAADPSAVNATRADGRTPIFAPCHTGALEVIRTLIDADADVDHRENDGWLPLHLAANAGQLGALDLLLASGATLALAEDGQVTRPVYLAASNGHDAVLERLLALGCSPQQPGQGGWTPLHAAAYDDHSGAIGLLARAGAPIDARLDDDGFTALQIAAFHDRAAAVDALAEHGADLEARADHGQRKACTALHIAATRGAVDAARALLRAGAAADANDGHGETPLSLALARDDLKMAAALIDEGANPDALVNRHQTCLHRAAHDDDVRRIRFLLDHGASALTPDAIGRSPIHLAAMEGKEAALKLMIDAGADPARPDADGSTPLHHAARRGWLGAVALLVGQPGIDPGAADPDRLTPLHQAAEAGQAAVVELLLERGVAVDARDLDGWTALHLAAQAGHADVVQALLSKGAAVDAQTRRPSAFALQLAAETGQTAVVQALLAAGADPEAATADKPPAYTQAARYFQYETLAALERVPGAEAAAERDPVAPPGARPAATATPPGIAAAFNAPATSASGGSDAPGPGSPDPQDDAQAALHARELTASVGPMHYRWRSAPAGLGARLADAAPQWIRPDDELVIEATGLAWYPQAELLRVRTPRWPEPRPTLYFVRSADDRLVRLEGKSPPIHALAVSEGIALDASNILGYLKFFCFFVRGDEGAFYILEHADDPLLAGRIDPLLRTVLNGTVRKAAYRGTDDNGKHICDGIVWYGSTLFVGQFSIGLDGMVTMLDDEPITSELPIRPDAPIG